MKGSTTAKQFRGIET